MSTKAPYKHFDITRFMKRQVALFKGEGSFVNIIFSFMGCGVAVVYGVFNPKSLESVAD